MGEMPTARWLAPVLIAVVSLAVAGGLLARDLYQREEPATAAEVPLTTSLKPGEQPGPSDVKLTPDAARHPQAETVRQLLNAYFDGINGRNYERWKTAVSEKRIEDKPEAQFRLDYRSTRNGSIVLHRIESAPGGRLRILLSFTSTQDVRDAPPTLRATCIRWDLNWPLERENGDWKLAKPPQGTKPETRKC